MLKMQYGILLANHYQKALKIILGYFYRNLKYNNLVTLHTGQETFRICVRIFCDIHPKCLTNINPRWYGLGNKFDSTYSYNAEVGSI